MKTIKVLMIAIIALFTFEGAKAQIVVKARVGTPVHRHYYHHRPVHRRVVVTRRVHRPYHHRATVVHRRVVRHY